jgi:hypothetical protein
MDRSVWIYVACAVAGMLVWHVLWSRLRAWFDRSGRQRRARLALRAERAAEKILRKAGFRVLEAQARISWPVVFGDETLLFELRADFIVEDDRRYVAEVKTGDVVSLRHGGTRRQLLEYLLAFDVDGVLLIDPARGDN